MKKLILLLPLLIFFKCQQKKSIETNINQDARFDQYIAGVTTGIISKKDNVSIQFSEQVNLPESIADNILKVSPKISGKLVKSGNALIFSPERDFKSGTTYQVSLALNQLVELPKELKSFEFVIETITQDFEINLQGLKSDTDPKVFELEGSIQTADYIEEDEAKKMLNIASQNIEWNHASGTNHQFKIKGIKRLEKAFELEIKADGNAIGLHKKTNKSVVIPSTKDYSLRSISVNKGSNSYVSLNFTDPLKSNQNLNGLITINGEPNPKFVIDGNQVQIYLSRMQSGSQPIHIESGIKNVFGYPLKESIDQYISFDPEKPQLKLVGKGSILPSSKGLVLPFDAVNLSSVRVSVVQIFEKNIPQFLQSNQLDGREQIKRTGRKIITKKIDLSEYSENLSNWNRFHLDLSSLFETEKGAIYQVTLNFRPEDSFFPCEEVLNSGLSEEVIDNNWSVFENDGFDYWGDYSPYYYPSGYRWDQRDNPCHVSYYNRSRYVQRNLIASDLGVIAKIGGDNSVNIYTTNMITAAPEVSKVTLLDYQLQLIGESETDANGMISFIPERRPFLVIAESNGQKSYLKLDDGTSLSMSNFDVSGTRIKDGIKGFIYGERGVWRPGNDIYLTFVLEDLEDRVPSDQPVIFELRDPRGKLKDRQVISNGIKNTYVFKTKTDASDETGNWRASVKVGNTGFSKLVKVETIKPNRLKINLDFGMDKISYENRNIRPTLSINWLTGITGENLKAETEVDFRSINTTFDGYSNFEFDDPHGEVYATKKLVFQGTTDQNGNVQFNYQLPKLEAAGGAVKAVFETKGFEPGGDFSINSKSITYYPFESFVGLLLPDGDEWGRLKRNQSHQAKVVSIASDGSKISSRKLKVKIYKVDWRWWWDRSEDYSINYIRNSNQNIILEKNFVVSNGEGIVPFKLDRWGRYLMIIEDPISGHSTGDYLYIGWDDSEQNELGASFMAVNSSKTKYNVGEEIELSIPGTANGQALVSIENGSKVVQHFWTKTQEGKTTIKLKASKEMAPNVYAHVTLLQPHAQTVNDLPIRLYGMTPIKVLDPETLLEPVIEIADELNPGKEVKISVSEKKKKL